MESTQRTEPVTANPEAPGLPRINVPALVAGKNPGLLKVIPSPVVRYLERILHVRELNQGLENLESLQGVEFVRGVLDLMGVSVEVAGAEYLDSGTRSLVVANHPLGGLDGIAMMWAVGNRHADIKIAANDFLTVIPNLAEWLVPVDKHGSNRHNIHAFEAAFAGDATVVHFPAGLCSRKKGKRIRDLDWQKSFVTRARRHRRDVIPVHVDGHNSAFFYNLARLRRWSGLGFNLEMVYLVDEMFRQRGRTIRLRVGEPIPWQTFDATHTDWEWARRLKHHVYRIGTVPGTKFTPH